LAGVPAVRPVLDDRRARLRDLCSPVPPGFGDRSGTSGPIALAALGGPRLGARRARLRALCSPVPPGFGDRSGTSVPIALAVLGGLVLVESLAARRARHLRTARR